MPEPIRVLIVDDHARRPRGLRTFLDLQDGIEVVGEAGDGEEALARGRTPSPGRRPDRPGDAEAGRRPGDAPPPRASAEGARDRADELPRGRAAAAGDPRRCAGYLLKSVQPQELARAVRAAAAGEVLIDPAVAARLVETLADGREERAERLTPREREVLALVGRGFANKRIASELGIAEKTVKTHVSNVLAKLGVADRTQAALYAPAGWMVDRNSTSRGWWLRHGAG